MAVEFPNLKFYVGPDAVLPAGPANTLDNLEKVIIDFIDGAKRSLDIAVQEVDSEPIARAIIRASLRTFTLPSGKQRRLSVRLVSEADYLSVSKPPPDVFNPPARLKNETNRVLHAALLRAKAWVRTDFNPNIFHQKFIVRDGDAVLTGSTNFTHTGTHNNLNHILIVHDKAVAKIFDTEFDEISKGHFGKYNVSVNKTPKEVIVDDIRVKVCSAPDHAPEMEITKQMAKAKQRVDFAIFTFSKTSAIDDAMKLLIDANRVVRGALDKGQGSRDWAATLPLKKAGADLHFVRKKKPLGKLHHKLMVIDDSVTVIGSFNYTGPANRLNDENIVVLGDDDNPTPNQRTLARMARAEIERIITNHATPVKIVIDPATGKEKAD